MAEINYRRKFLCNIIGCVYYAFYDPRRSWLYWFCFCKILNSLGFRPLVFDLFTYSGRIENLLGCNFDLIKGDVKDFNTLHSTISNFKPDIVINFAAESHVDRSIYSLKILLVLTFWVL